MHAYLIRKLLKYEYEYSPPSDVEGKNADTFRQKYVIPHEFIQLLKGASPNMFRFVELGWPGNDLVMCGKE
jgi:hypothetical protein